MFDTQDLPATSAPQMDAPSLPVPGGSQPVHLLDRLAAVMKHRRIAGAAFVLVVGVMMVQTYSQVPMYRTSSRVMIQDERTTAVGNLNANDPAFWQDRIPTTTRSTASFAAAGSRDESCASCNCRITRCSTAPPRSGRALR